MTKLEEIIAFAIDQERKAADLYEKTAAKIKDRGARKMLSEMASMERMHEMKLRKMSEGTLTLVQARGRVDDMRIADLLTGKELSPESALDEVFVYAIKAEADAFDLYTRLSTTMQDPEMKSLLQSLAEEEKQHRLDLEAEYEREFLRDN